MASDYQVVIKDIDQGTSAPYGAIIQEVIARKLSMTSCHLMYESRNCNFEAHHLAKHASSLDVGRHIWLGMPYDPVNISVNIISLDVGRHIWLGMPYDPVNISVNIISEI
uniref:RNase H type-1 domain-containing protein n=3 Tax=Aegilops tauschii subsp. strangulata TaxID=200361 RepID=A0A453ST20_AEGTS